MQTLSAILSSRDRAEVAHPLFQQGCLILAKSSAPKTRHARHLRPSVTDKKPKIRKRFRAMVERIEKLVTGTIDVMGIYLLEISHLLPNVIDFQSPNALGFYHQIFRHIFDSYLDNMPSLGKILSL